MCGKSFCSYFLWELSFNLWITSSKLLNGGSSWSHTKVIWTPKCNLSGEIDQMICMLANIMLANWSSRRSLIILDVFAYTFRENWLSTLKGRRNLAAVLQLEGIGPPYRSTLFLTRINLRVEKKAFALILLWFINPVLPVQRNARANNSVFFFTLKKNSMAFFYTVKSR